MADKQEKEVVTELKSYSEYHFNGVHELLRQLYLFIYFMVAVVVWLLFFWLSFESLSMYTVLPAVIIGWIVTEILVIIATKIELNRDGKCPNCGKHLTVKEERYNFEETDVGIRWNETVSQYDYKITYYCDACGYSKLYLEGTAQYCH